MMTEENEARLRRDANSFMLKSKGFILSCVSPTGGLDHFTSSDNLNETEKTGLLASSIWHAEAMKPDYPSIKEYDDEPSPD